MNRFIFCGAILLISAAAYGATDAEIAERIRDAEPKGREAVIAKLKDPDSAQFRNTRPTADGLYLCGEVNAKNSMGGYTGFKRFYVLWQFGVASIQGEGSYLDEIFRNRCEK